MKRQNKKHRLNSIYVIYLKSFLIFSAFVLLIMISIYAAISYKIDNTVWGSDIDDLLTYSDILKKDEFSKLPLQKFKNSSFIILDEDYSVIFRNNNTFDISINKSELDCITDYDSSMYFSVSKFYKDGQTRYLIELKKSGNEIADNIQSYCIIDDKYNIIEGNLFKDKKSITKNEFNYLIGDYSDKYYVSKHIYQNDRGKMRAVVYFSPIINSDTYNSVFSSIYNLWWLFIPTYVTLLILAVILISKKTKKWMSPLNKAILGFSYGKSSGIENYSGPKEFMEIARNFDSLTKQLSASEEERRHLDADKQRILADISHDLKTPITVIQGYSKALSDGLIKENEKDKYIKLIAEKAEALCSLTDAFFEYSKLDHPEFHIDKELCNITEFCKEYLAEKYQEIDCAGFILDIDLPNEYLACLIDKKMFKKALENLFNNALKYSGKNSTLYFSLKAANDIVIINIADNGAGIPENIINNLFEPFVIGDYARSSGKGTGLGLSIVKKIINAHGGSIKLVNPSKGNKSTDFEITLPRIKE